MKMHRQTFYSGRVQGVGFRYGVKQIATGYQVVGWVRNLPDGRVEVQAGGEPEEIDAFFTAVATGQLASHIKAVSQNDLPPPDPAWTGFQIHR